MLRNISVDKEVIKIGLKRFDILSKYIMEKNKFFKLSHYPFRIVLISGIFLFVFKFFFSDKYLAILSNSILEFLILFFIYILLFLSTKIFSEKNRTASKVALCLFYVLTILNLFLFLMNSAMLDESLLMKYSLIDFNIGVVAFLFTDILPLKYILLGPVFILGIFLVSLFNLSEFEKIEKYFKFIFAAFFIFCLLIFFFSFNSLSNIYASTLHEKINNRAGMEIPVNNSRVLEATCNSEVFSRQIGDYSQYNVTEGHKIILFVMEQTSYRTFFEEINKIPKDENFFEKVKPYTHTFTNYYTTNQDSMTAVWTMMNSEFIPFECYSNDWAKKYGYVLEANNLVDLLNRNGYETHIVSSVFLPGMIQDAHNWSNATFLKPDTKEEGFFCLHEYEYEPGCEDRIILNDMENIIEDKRGKDYFIFQEFIYGHGEEYLEKLKKTNSQYANDYLLELYGFLEQRDLLENVTIIVTADHGEKGYYEKELWNYKVPFMIIDKNLEYREIDSLYSHMDFKDILLSYLNNEELNQSSEGKFFMGQTQSSEIGYIDKYGNYLLAKLSDDDVFTLKESRGLSIEEITTLAETLLRCRYESIEKSSKKNYWCSNCDATMKKAGLM